MDIVELPVRLPLPGDHLLNRKSTLHWRAHEHYMKRKIWIGLKFNARAIWRQPRAGNWAEQSKLIVRPPQNHWKWRKLWNQEKHAKTSGFIDFSTSNMHFRSADAANHLNARPAGKSRVTHRAYILRYISSMVRRILLFGFFKNDS